MIITNTYRKYFYLNVYNNQQMMAYMFYFLIGRWILSQKKD